MIERPNEKLAKQLKEKEEQQKRLKQKQEKATSVKVNGSKLTNGHVIRLVRDLVIIFLKSGIK